MENLRIWSSYTSKCKFCGSERLYKDDVRGEIFCENCGHINEDHCYQTVLDKSDDKGKEENIGGAEVNSPLHLTVGLQSKIGGSVDKLSNSDHKLRRTNKRVVYGKTKRSLWDGIVEIRRISSKLNLPDAARETAAILFREANEDDFCSGRPIESVVAACVYSSCREFKIPKPLQEVTECISGTKKEVRRLYMELRSEFDIQHEPLKPSDYYPRYTSEIGITGEAVKTGRKIIEKSKISGKNPRGIVAAVLNILIDEYNFDITMSRISDVVGISTVTIRKRRREIRDNVDIEKMKKST